MKMLFFKKMKHKKLPKASQDNLPLHIAIIPDGNGRWATKRGLPRNMGHREGSKVIREIVLFANEIGIKYLTIYAFSTENWKRPKDEVAFLMELIQEFLDNAEEELSGINIKIKVIGNLKGLSESLQKRIPEIETATMNNTGLVLNIALNYGGRDEIVEAVRKIAREIQEDKIKIKDIDETVIENRLYTAGIPEPDLMIRTAGEKRISNFLLWQCAYTEMWYTDVLWPDFLKGDLLLAIQSYQTRKRRFGGI